MLIHDITSSTIPVEYKKEPPANAEGVLNQLRQTTNLHTVFAGVPQPNFLTLYFSDEIHEGYKKEKQRACETKQSDKARTIKFYHGPAQAL